MEIKFADSFWDSLKVLQRHQTWWYKLYETFRYKIPMFFENVWFFKKELWRFRSWDYSFNLFLFKRSLEKTLNTLEGGMEIELTRMKKVEKIKRVVKLIENLDESYYIEKAEEELGTLKNVGGFFDDVEDTPEDKEHNRKVFLRAQEIEDGEWDELWTILKGQNYNEYKALYDSLSPEEREKSDVWGNWFDGSGIKGWWD